MTRSHSIDDVPLPRPRPAPRGQGLTQRAGPGGEESTGSPHDAGSGPDLRGTCCPRLRWLQVDTAPTQRRLHRHWELLQHRKPGLDRGVAALAWLQSCTRPGERSALLRREGLYSHQAHEVTGAQPREPKLRSPVSHLR
jgi:hypothetical protein